MGDKLRFSNAPDLEGGGIEALPAHAGRVSRQFKDEGPNGQRVFLFDWVEHIERRQDRVNVMLRIDAILGAPADDAIGSNQPRKHDRSPSGVTLELPLALNRHGVESKFVRHQGGTTPDANLVHAVALGHKWFAEIKDGVVRSVSDLAQRHGVNQGDVSRVIRFGLLAPGIVEAILDGRQPVELTAARLKCIGELPICWQEQRRVLGFA